MESTYVRRSLEALCRSRRSEEVRKSDDDLTTDEDAFD